MADCSVCCEKFNKSTHLKVSCNYCDYETCRSCIQRYLLDITNDPHCMQCKNVWNREFIDSACTKSFRNKELKNHRENILFERQKCLLPDTQIFVTRVKQTRQLAKFIEDANIEIDTIRRKIASYQNQMYTLSQTPNPNETATERKKFVRKCPVSACRGFLSTQWKCEICENKICPECNEVKNEDHECDPNNVETVKLLKKDTKPCPKCGTMIFKISGCAQMWCPDCHTAFNWNTMQIETGVIHNPHYYEFQRIGGGGRNHGDIPCGGLPNIQELCRALGVSSSQHHYRLKSVLPEKDVIFVDIHQLIAHIQYEELQYRYAEPREPDYREVRVKYLMNEMSEDAVKHVLQRDEKAHSKIRDIFNILTMFVNTASDILRQFILDKSKKDEYINIFGNLREYTNGTLQTISKRYNCVTPTISEKWGIQRLKA